MPPPYDKPSTQTAPLRHATEMLTLIVVLFVLQTGLIPFDFLHHTAAGSHELFGVSRSRFTYPDIITNIFLYIPVGLLLHASLRHILGNAWLALILAIGVGTSLSAGIEWIQSYSPTRVSSLIDLTCNALGTCGGAIILNSLRWIGSRMYRAVRREFRQRPAILALKAYCSLLVIAAVLPFSLSADVGLLKRSFRSATLVPFAAVHRHQQQAEAALAREDHDTYARERWMAMKSWSRWTAAALSFAALAWLLQLWLRHDYGFHSRSAFALSFWYGAIFAVALSLVQLPVVTRDFNITDILSRLLGLTVGLGMLAWYDHARLDPVPARRRTWQRRLARIGCAAATGYIVYIGLIPLVFDRSRNSALDHLLASSGWLPFFAYFSTRFDIMMDDVMEKFTAYGLFAVLLVASSVRLQRRNLRRRTIVVATYGVMISIPLEITQMFMPVRVASLTDLILAAGGCTVGVLALARTAEFVRSAAALGNASPGSRLAGEEPLATLADDLLGTLLDPIEEAPVEPSPTSQPDRQDVPSGDRSTSRR